MARGGQKAATHSYLQNRTARKIALATALMLTAYLIGYVPPSLSARAYESQLADVKRKSRLTSIRASLAEAALNANRGEYEESRQETSEFFTKLRAELERDDTIITNADRERVNDILSHRDDVITLLARGDGAAGKVLTNWYFDFDSLK